MVAPKAFAIAAEIPLVGNLVLTIWHKIIEAALNQNVFKAAETPVAVLFATFLRVSYVWTTRKSFLAFSHCVSNVVAVAAYSRDCRLKH